jgi:hypothetical protein
VFVKLVSWERTCDFQFQWSPRRCERVEHVIDALGRHVECLYEDDFSGCNTYSPQYLLDAKYTSQMQFVASHSHKRAPGMLRRF